MGVFKWLRRERVTVTHHNVSPGVVAPEESQSHSEPHIPGTIRTDEYKKALAEFQARRSSTSKDQTPVKKKCGRHSLPLSCTHCTAANDHDSLQSPNEKKSAGKYKKKTQKRARSTTPDRNLYEGVGNIQFLFQNQVFMPGNLFPTASYSESHKFRRQSRHRVSRSPDMDVLFQKHIDFKDDDQPDSPTFYKNSTLAFDVNNFINCTSEDRIDGAKAAGDLNSSQNSGASQDKDGDEKLNEVMSELNNLDQWADEQLNSKSDDTKSDTSAYGLSLASASNIDVGEKKGAWSQGNWGSVPVQIKKLVGVTVEHIRMNQNTEINILRKCRHPNIILLMGLYPDIRGNVQLICERCVDSLYGVLHVQGRILTAQSSVQYALDIANALVFLRMQGYIHTDINSESIMITSHDTAKLADLHSCVKLNKRRKKSPKNYEIYSPEPLYVNIEDTRENNTADYEPLLSKRSSETYISSNAVPKDYQVYQTSDKYRWQAPELFVPDDDGLVYPCGRSDVYSLCLVLWESCNAVLPWKNFTYDKLKEQYTLWKTGIQLPQDGTYPGCLLALLQSGLALQRNERIDMETLQTTLTNVKNKLEELGYIIIPARLTTKRSTFSSVAWDTTSPTDSDCLSPQNIQHKAIIHTRDSSTESEKDCTKSDISPLYETIQKHNAQKCFISDDDNDAPIQYQHLPEKDYSSACSTPIAKLKARIKDMETPGSFHRSDSTEYCSILSPNRTVNFNIDDNEQSAERPNAKLSRSFTPKSYKPLHIKVPEYNLDSIKPFLKNSDNAERSSYNFDIRNYSLPSTPIARSNKLRKNAWLSGDIGTTERKSHLKENTLSPHEKGCKNETTSPEVPTTINTSLDTATNLQSSTTEERHEESPDSNDTVRNSVTGLRRTNPPQDSLTPESDDTARDRYSWSPKSNQDRNSQKYKIEEDILAGVNVKPLVAIHERWIYEANRKTCRSLSLPEDTRIQIPAVKPASHCVDTLQKSLPQLNTKKNAGKIYRALPATTTNGRNGNHWEQFCQARDTIAKGVNFTREPERSLKRNVDKSTSVENTKAESKSDQSTDTKSIEEFIRDMIRKEFQHLLHEITDDSSVASRNEDLVNKGVANIIDTLNDDPRAKKEPSKTFSRVKINGNNKPLLQITFSRSGENSLQVLDNCVNVTFCDTNNVKEKINQSLEDTLTDEVQINSLKRCQAFNALQEARSTEDLYIDDDISTMQDNFGGKVKLIPLHGSLHEILCEKEDECCLIKVKQENGCDTIYFRCDNSDTESRDAIDGHDQDTVVFKRSISLVEERIQRVPSKEKRSQTPILVRKTRARDQNVRPKSEVFPKLNVESRVLSNSSPSLATNRDEVEVNIENVVSYQDSSSDECIKCQTENDDFELLERKIEEDIALQRKPSLCGCLEKISEENLAVLSDEIGKD